MRWRRRWQAFRARPGRAAPAVAGRGGAGGGRLFVVPIAHLDTQWRWTVRDSIARHLPKTIRQNLAAFERFPGYVLNLDGSFRYRLMAEYYPAEFEQVRRAVLAGRWHPAGCFVDAADVNLPSPESIVRHVLYGNGYFARTFGIRNRDIFLPDCFGFGFALPSIAAHCGIRGFSSQKLGKGRSARPLPFALGRWQGPDGAEIVAALDPGGYGELLLCDLSRDPESIAAVRAQEESSGVPVALRYFGIGDTGGAPEDGSLWWLERSLARGGELEVRAGASGRIFAELTPAEIAGLPSYRGELLMRLHATGCYTSQAAMKRWNGQNQRLAAAAECAAAAVHWLGVAPYPRQRLEAAWERFLWHQFHDDLTGTSVPAAYAYSWNDEVLSLNQFAGVLNGAVAAIACALDTECVGEPLVVFNALAAPREGIVEVDLPADGVADRDMVVSGPDGEALPTQLTKTRDGTPRLLVRARVPAAGFAVLDLRPATPAMSDERPAGPLVVADDLLENAWLRARFDSAGNLASLWSHATGREHLAAPLRYELLANRSLRFPAWEIRWEDVQAVPREVLGGPCTVRVLERGPVRVALEIRRRLGESEFVDRWFLAAGERELRAECEIHWQTRGRLLKLAFPAAVTRPVATYDLGLGTIERETNSPDLYEVPAQHWADLTGTRGGSDHGEVPTQIGLAIVADCKHGWDRPTDSTLRLTLLHTPAVGRRFRHQGKQDLGQHRFAIALVPHQSTWNEAGVPERAAAILQPLRGFRAPASRGPLGRELSLLEVQGAMATAIKIAEESDEIVVRVQEARGEPAPEVLVRARAGLSAREVNGGEEPISLRSPATAAGSTLSLSLGAYQSRAFALRLDPPSRRLGPLTTQPLDLPFDLDVVSANEDRADGDFDGHGRTIPAELLQSDLDLAGIPFRFGPTSRGSRNALSCRGQVLSLPAAGGMLHLLAAAAVAEARVVFAVGDHEREVTIGPWRGFLGQWNAPLRRDELAWVGTHTHTPQGDDPYDHCYLFRYVIEIPEAAASLRLPVDPSVRILAMTHVAENCGAAPAVALYD